MGDARGVPQEAEEAAEEAGGRWGFAAAESRDRGGAEQAAQDAAQTGDKYDELLAKGARYDSKQDHRNAAKAYRKAVALEPNQPVAYFNLGNALSTSGHYVEAAQRYLEAKGRFSAGSVDWAEATALAFCLLQHECAEEAKPAWWNDDGLKALSARVVRVAPNDVAANQMRALVLSGCVTSWEVGPRSAAELKEAAKLFDQAAALSDAPAQKAGFASAAAVCRSQTVAM